MARAAYQYETSPKKLQPEVKKKNTRKKLEVIETTSKSNSKVTKNDKKEKTMQIFLVIAVFATFLVISYRNSLINEEFKVIQSQKNNLATIQKENKQLEIGLESSLNLNNIEKIATEKLGMKKQTSNQTVYIELSKSDYIEVPSEKIEKENKGLFDIILKIFNR